MINIQNLVFVSMHLPHEETRMGGSFYCNRLCAITLYNTLERCGVNPREQIYISLFDNTQMDKLAVLDTRLSFLKEIREEGFIIIALGRTVDTYLNNAHIICNYLPYSPTSNDTREVEDYVLLVNTLLMDLK